jgi:hypothetical protein
MLFVDAASEIVIALAVVQGGSEVPPFGRFALPSVVPGTQRDSLLILGLLLEPETDVEPTEIMTDTVAYADTVFGLFLTAGLPVQSAACRHQRPSLLAHRQDGRLRRV